MTVADIRKTAPLVIAVLAGLLAAPMARPEIVDAQVGGFTVRESVTIAASPDRVWGALAHVGRWWDPAHTYSGDAASISIELKPGGFWLESLPEGGGARHMVVVQTRPGRLLRLEGALGPLQAMGVNGHLTLAFEPKAGATTVTQTYDVGGHAQGGLDKLAAPVDHVLTQQLDRLKRYVETGSPN
jgi:uncharacterized protein YndB with AHSA1/START domain